MRIFAIVLAIILFPAFDANAQAELDGNWNCFLESPGGELRFGIVIAQEETGAMSASITNGSEKISIPFVRNEAGKITFEFNHYDSVISCRLEGDNLSGDWRKRRGVSEWVEMKFKADRETSGVFQTQSNEADKFKGRWLVDFAKSDDPAVAIFSANKDRTMGGTFLTTTGDYRFLHGNVVDGELQLSCFDGAHAFLFKARPAGDNSLKGDFWSSNTWHECWTAERNQEAALPDAFQQTKLLDGKPLGEYQFPDLDGKLTRLDDEKFNAKAKLLYVFGSWCPNCHDAAAYFSELKKKYGDDLSIVGLAFELTGDFERDSRQAKLYLKRHNVDYPVLVAGLADKKLATKTIPFLDRVRSYPTTIFLDSKNNVKAIHTGFTGPATGNAYDQMKAKFTSLIDSMIHR